MNAFPGVIGAVGELISFPVELEAAMTTALGGGVQDLITDSRISARNAINQLKRNRAGRATFLPLDGLRQYGIPQSTVTTLESYEGFRGVASDLVESKTERNINAAINYLLGSVIIVDTIDTALSISKRINRYRTGCNTWWFHDWDKEISGITLHCKTATENQSVEPNQDLTKDFERRSEQLETLVDQAKE